MTIHLFIAPAAAGKTTYVLTRARVVAQGLTAVPRVVVPTHLQARAARRRLAEMGGAIGVRVLTFDRVYAEVLNAAGEIYTELSEPVQFRLMRAVVADAAVRTKVGRSRRPGWPSRRWSREPPGCRDWPLLAVDGFDNFTSQSRAST